MRKEPRLHFTKEEREDPALEKTIRRTDRAAAPAEKPTPPTFFDVVCRPIGALPQG